MLRSLKSLLVLAFLCAAPALHAFEYTHSDVQKLLKAPHPPDGVVFELISWDERTWAWAAPMISQLRQQLKHQFPDIDVVVVSHGGEQFQLTRERQHEQPDAIAQLRSLSEDGVNVHVCGTHSSWKDVAESAYIDFIDVSPSGPAQINDYIKLGYQHILLQKPL